MEYRLTATVIEKLLQYAETGAPKEVCGFAFAPSAWPVIEFDYCMLIPNQSQLPIKTFEMDGMTFQHAVELAKRAGLILAIWHSHPDSQPTPSQEDFALISQLSVIPFIIVGVTVPAVTIYEVAELGRVREAYRHGVTV